MATIQIRDIPDDVHASLTRLAQDAGQSLQSYMRHQVMELSATAERKAAAIRTLQRYLDAEGGLGMTAEQIVEQVHAARR